jgi:hypothetical protein
MKGFFEYEYLKFKKEYLKNLVAVANSTGKMSEEEFKYIYKVGERYELKPKHVDSILARKEELVPNVPTSHESRINQLYDFINAMFSNTIDENKDITYLKKLTQTFGFKEALAEILIRYYKATPHLEGEWEKLVEEAKEYNL